MVAISVLMFVLIFWLQNLTRFGSEVGFAYQSPPPLYFSNAICTCWEKARVPVKRNINRSVFFIEANVGNLVGSVEDWKYKSNQ